MIHHSAQWNKLITTFLTRFRDW